MALGHTITIEGEDGVLKVGEIEAFIGAAHDAQSGVHQPVTVSRGRDGKVRLSIDITTGDEPAAEE